MNAEQTQALFSRTNSRIVQIEPWELEVRVTLPLGWQDACSGILKMDYTHVSYSTGLAAYN